MESITFSSTHKGPGAAAGLQACSDAEHAAWMSTPLVTRVTLLQVRRMLASLATCMQAFATAQSSRQCQPNNKPTSGWVLMAHAEGKRITPCLLLR